MNNPLVTIGLPVFNGEKYLREALDSIINQTYQNLEIIISDNASTDKTQEICEECAKQDTRIVYHRYDENRGAVWNHNNCFKLATKGKYFKWVAHDDVLEQAMIEECVNVLEENEDVALCHTPISVIDEKGDELSYNNLKMHFMHDCPAERFKDYLNHYEHRPWVTAIYGVFRRDMLAKIKPWLPCLASDIEFAADTASIGKVYELEIPLLKLRLHLGKSTMIKTRPELISYNIGKTKRKFLSNYFRWFVSLGSIIKSMNISKTKKLKAYFKLWSWLLSKPQWLLSEIFHFLNSLLPFEKLLNPIRFFFIRKDFEKSRINYESYKTRTFGHR